MLVNQILSFVVLQFSNVMFAEAYEVYDLESDDLGNCCEAGITKTRVWECDEKSLSKRVCVKESCTSPNRHDVGCRCIPVYYCGSGVHAACAGKNKSHACYDTIEGNWSSRGWIHTLYYDGICMLQTERLGYGYGTCDTEKAVVCSGYRLRTLTWIEQHWAGVVITVLIILVILGLGVFFCVKKPNAVRAHDMAVTELAADPYINQETGAFATNCLEETDLTELAADPYKNQEARAFATNCLVEPKETDLYINQVVKAFDLKTERYWDATIIHKRTQFNGTTLYEVKWLQGNGTMLVDKSCLRLAKSPAPLVSPETSKANANFEIARDWRLYEGCFVQATYSNKFYDAIITAKKVSDDGHILYDVIWSKDVHVGTRGRKNLKAQDLRLDLSRPAPELVDANDSDLGVGYRVKVFHDLAAEFRDATITNIKTDPSGAKAYDLNWGADTEGGGFKCNVPTKSIWLDPSSLVAVEEFELRVGTRVKAKRGTVFWDAAITKINTDSTKTCDLVWEAETGGGFEHNVPLKEIRRVPGPASTPAIAPAQVIPLNDPRFQTVIAAPVETPIAEAKIEDISADPTPIVYPVNEAPVETPIAEAKIENISADPTPIVYPVNETHVVSTFDNLSGWLAALNMSQYQQAFENDGYDQKEILVELSKDDILAIEGMKKGHAIRICKAIDQLKA